ncbi:DegT/DnrJ/EryC1/StrS family aminotransferase [uncultured Parvibaculum sp.]|uniref:DegT/DnrJ/EryC1/StrS family aminotransferase n=1 Tax=uncultured Parvibaculum sp. TaxID=291828 RepID=UPI0030D713A2
MSRPLYVASPILPKLDDLRPYLEGIWDRRMLTNGGPLHDELEEALSRHLGIPTAMLFNNGTIALMTALRMFDLPSGGEVITTPLTFAATAHAISWNGLAPVFADVSPDDLTLDPASVEAAITPKTSAILAVHVYGTVCDLDALQDIATRHGLPLIYDAAHAFGTTVSGRPIGTFGDASVFSFHATKLFHTFEGGLLATNREEDRQTIYYLRNFGIKNEEEVVGIGINGKMNELQAMIGLLNLPQVEDERQTRAKLRQNYKSFLSDLPGIRLQPDQPGVSNSEQYFALQIDPEKFGRTRDDVYEALKSMDIFARKYFHPICTDFEPYRGYPIHSVWPQPAVDLVKTRVLCLPFHGGVEEQDIAQIRAVFLS